MNTRGTSQHVSVGSRLAAQLEKVMMAKLGLHQDTETVYCTKSINLISDNGRKKKKTSLFH